MISRVRLLKPHRCFRHRHVPEASLDSAAVTQTRRQTLVLARDGEIAKQRATLAFGSRANGGQRSTSFLISRSALAWSPHNVPDCKVLFKV